MRGKTNSLRADVVITYIGIMTTKVVTVVIIDLDNV